MRFRRGPIAFPLKEFLTKQPHCSPGDDRPGIALLWVPISTILLKQTPTSIVPVNVGDNIRAWDMCQAVDGRGSQRVGLRSDDEDPVPVAIICRESYFERRTRLCVSKFPECQGIETRDLARFYSLGIIKCGVKFCYVRLKYFFGKYRVSASRSSVSDSRPPCETVARTGMLPAAATALNTPLRATNIGAPLRNADATTVTAFLPSSSWPASRTTFVMVLPS